MIKIKKKASVGNSYSWRPNFRNYDELPDVRTVRTQFFFPIVSLCIAAVFTVFILFQEYRAMDIRKNMAELEVEIESYQARHDEKVKLNAEFMGISRTLDEIVEFKANRLVASDYLLTLSSHLLEGMYLTKVEYMATLATIEGSVQVPAEEASRLVNQYLKSIQEADALQGLLNEYKLTSLERGEAGQGIKFRIEVLKKEEEVKK
ncbi:hypothetical protein [Pelagicoccus mobilis]|uniref:Uncharacterized protein n=1 Tax=Pelagicoccus mobilis TaxID=415221 RepID=A0A934S3E5_9BACT|nr:hypothetical protein [Pelagicoccus mobilis]MBK1879946.1 hypothetical protein [Pelagicoccus mobilis]